MRLQTISLIFVGGAFLVANFSHSLGHLTAPHNPLPATPEVLAAGQATFQQHCVSYHGVEGRGDGPAVAALPDRPASLTQSQVTAHGDDQIFGWINGGKPGTSMPAFGQQLSDEEI
jgi:mono/diheme cytochrome c family protein